MATRRHGVWCLARIVDVTADSVDLVQYWCSEPFAYGAANAGRKFCRSLSPATASRFGPLCPKGQTGPGARSVGVSTLIQAGVFARVPEPRLASGPLIP